MELIKGTKCRKCGSKGIYLESDMGVWYEHCLMCGYQAPLPEVEPGRTNGVHPAEDIAR